MAKQFIIAAMEEVVGEYVLNFSKENLKVAALSGKIKLENVQLDGDLVGSHFLSLVGLGSGFGVLSCSARSITVTVPWGNLEHDPTKFEVSGVHLVCVPLTPATAHCIYGAGTLVDPRCTLRTRAKRLLLARLERNYWNGQVHGEGPPMKRISRAVKDVERDWRKRQKETNQLQKSIRRGRSASRRNISSNDVSSSLSSTSHNPYSFSSLTTPDEKSSTADEIVEALEKLALNLDNVTSDGSIIASVTTSSVVAEDKSSKDTSFEDFSELSPSMLENLPEIPLDWKAKLREKLLRNMEASLYDVHIRVEVSERGLNCISSSKLNFDFESVDVSSATFKQDSGLSSLIENPDSLDDLMGEIKDRCDRPLASKNRIEDRAFAFGFTLESLIVRTANEMWEVGSHDKKSTVDGVTGIKHTIDERYMTSVQDHLGPNEYCVKNNKIGFFTKLAMYWDDQPPVMLAETDMLRGNYRNLMTAKIQSRIAIAMEAMSHTQDPGETICKSLGVSFFRWEQCYLQMFAMSTAPCFRD
jgi:hypothetical protein